MIKKSRLFTLLLAFTTSSLALGATNATMDELESDLLAKYRDAPPSTIIKVLGIPAGTTERDGSEFLTWESSKSTGTYVYGVGVAESYSCKATFEFLDNKLTGVSLMGTHGSDRSLCKKLVKPLLGSNSNGGNLAAKRAAAKATPTPTPTGTPAAQEVVTNADIVKLANAKLSDPVIIAKIRASECKFDISTDALISLKQVGVSDTVIQAMTESMAR